MNALNEGYYDEHIKSHQRHILVSWLESARSERIRAVKDKVKVHSVKVPVPHDVIEPIYLPEHGEDEKAAMRRRFEGITTGVELPEAVNVGREIVSAVLPEIKMPSAGTADISDILECLKADRSRIVRNEAQ